MLEYRTDIQAGAFSCVFVVIPSVPGAARCKGRLVPSCGPRMPTRAARGPFARTVVKSILDSAPCGFTCAGVSANLEEPHNEYGQDTPACPLWRSPARHALSVGTMVRGTSGAVPACAYAHARQSLPARGRASVRIGRPNCC